MLDGIVDDDTELFNDKLQRVGGLLQLQPAPRGPRWPNTYERLGQKTTESPPV